MKKSMTRLAGGLAITLALAACSGESGSSGESSDDTLTIAVQLGLSGPFGPVGTAEREGIEAAVAYLESGAEGDVKVELLGPVDDKNDPATGVSLARQLLADKPDVFIGSTGTAPANAILPLVQREGIPQFTFGLIGADTDLEKSNTFQFTVGATVEAAALKAFDNKRDYASRVLFYASSDYGKGFKLRAEEADLSFAGSEQVDVTGTDFAPQVTKLMKQDPDAVYVALGGQQLPILLRNLANAGFTGDVVSAQAIFSVPSSSISEIAGEAGTRQLYGPAVVPNLPEQDAADPRVKELELMTTWYEKTAGGDPNEDGLSAYVAAGWDSVLAAHAAWASARDAGTTLMDELGDLAPVQGTRSSITLGSKDHDAVGADDLVMSKFEKGSWTPIQ